MKNYCSSWLSLLILISVMIAFSSSFTLRILTSEQQHQILTQSQVQLLKQLKLVIDGSYQYIYPSANNNFELPGMSVGFHTIEVISNDFLFPVLFVNKMTDSNLKMNWLHPFDRKIIKKISEPYLIPLEKINYFQPEASFPILGFLLGGNGMFIIMGVLMVFCYKGMSKLAEAQMAPNAQASQEHSVLGGRGQRRTLNQ